MPFFKLLKFYVGNEISCAESWKMLQKVFEESGLTETGVCVWYKDFKSGRTMIEDLPLSGCPSTTNTEENVEKVKEIVLENRFISLRKLTCELNLAYVIAQYIVVDILNMRRVTAIVLVAARFVLKI